MKKLIKKNQKVLAVFFAVFAITLIYLFLVNIKISNTTGESMTPSQTNLKYDGILDGQTTLLKNANKESLKYGDIVTIEALDAEFSKSFKKNSYVKRIVGIEGDVIEFKNEKLLKNGEVYATSECFRDLEEIVIEKGNVFLLGDNYCNSIDSKFFGQINKELIKREVMFIFPAFIVFEIIVTFLMIFIAIFLFLIVSIFKKAGISEIFLRFFLISLTLLLLILMFNDLEDISMSNLLNKETEITDSEILTTYLKDDINNVRREKIMKEVDKRNLEIVREVIFLEQIWENNLCYNYNVYFLHTNKYLIMHTAVTECLRKEVYEINLKEER